MAIGTTLPSQLGTGSQVTVTADGVFTSTGQKIDLAITYYKRLGVIVSSSLANLNKLAKEVNIMGGVAICPLINRNVTRDYTQGTAPFDQPSQDAISIILDHRKEYTVTYESLDLLQMQGATLNETGITLEASFIQGVLEVKALAVSTYIAAKWLQAMVNAAKANPLFPIQTFTVDLSKVQTTEGQIGQYRSYLFRPLSKTLQSMKNIVTKNYLGIDSKQGVLCVAPETMTELLLTTTNLGDAGQTNLEEGVAKLDIIGGITCLEMPFLGETYPADKWAGFDQQENFDFTGMNAIWVHEEAAVMPINKGISQVVMDPHSGNVLNLHKFTINKNGAAILRPELIRGFNIVVLTAADVDQATYDSELQAFLTYFNTAANAVVAADASPLAAPLLAAIKAYAGEKTVIDPAAITTLTTNPVNAATVTAATVFNFTSIMPVVSGKFATQKPIASGVAYYKNA